MPWSRPTHEDLITCAGCGRIDCDSECEAYRLLEGEAIANEGRGIYIPSYCPFTDKKFCSRCGADVEERSPLCQVCSLALFN
jgi:hypothetical protein